MGTAVPAEKPDPTGSEYVAALFAGVERLPVETVPVTRLGGPLPVRAQAEDVIHTRRLADAGADVPPILVHRPSLKIIDGLHRMRAAVLNGRGTVAARFFDGTEHDAFLLAVAANVKHGLPLNAGERHEAAQQIAALHPDWSNRAVASVAGVSPHRVAEIRRRTGTPGTAATIGLDGRSRPVDGAEGRRRAAALFLDNPGCSVREVARRAAISPSTAADVRSRLLRGADPLPPRMRERAQDPAGSGRERAGSGQDPSGAGQDRTGTGQDRAGSDSLAELFDVLRRDPSLRFSESGRTLLRMFESCTRVDRQYDRILHHLPAHRADTIGRLLLACAESCLAMAEELRTAQGAPRRTSVS